MEINKDETFLARWMNGELSASELEAFKKHPDFQTYEKIIFKSDKLAAPPYDKQKLLQKVKDNLEQKSTKKVIPLYSKIASLVAAAVLIFFSIFFFNNSTTHKTQFGEQLTVFLPDSSEVILNAKSSISFKARKWEKDRSLNLTGEAFFKVKKGQKFTVNTVLGAVEVLGTQFNVDLDDDLIQVSCYEGKVKVSTNSKEVVLTKGKAFSASTTNSREWEFTEAQPNWQFGESTFDSVPLKNVIKAIEEQYNVTIKFSNDVDKNHLFTGVFTHNDLKTALETVCAPLKIRSEFTNKNTILLVKR